MLKNNNSNDNDDYVRYVAKSMYNFNSKSHILECVINGLVHENYWLKRLNEIRESEPRNKNAKELIDVINENTQVEDTLMKLVLLKFCKNIKNRTTRKKLTEKLVNRAKHILIHAGYNKPRDSNVIMLMNDLGYKQREFVKPMYISQVLYKKFLDYETKEIKSERTKVLNKYANFIKKLNPSLAEKLKNGDPSLLRKRIK